MYTALAMFHCSSPDDMISTSGICWCDGMADVTDSKSVVFGRVGSSPTTSTNRGVAQLVARLLWEQDAAGSNPVTPIQIFSIYRNHGRHW